MSDKPKFAFTKTNYRIMITGLVILIIGFFIMTQDNETYGFGFLGLTLGPIIVMLGFLTQFVAIFYKDRSSGTQKEDK
jgi:ATP/ADP translocase